MPSANRPTNFKATVGRNARWSLAQTVVSALTVFILYKFLYGYLGPEQLGLWAVVLASVSVGRLAELGFSTTILRYVSLYLAAGDRTRAARILETGLVSICGPFALALLVLYPFAVEAIRYAVPATSLAAAREILPYAFGTLWFGVTGSIAQSALDGCGRMDVKSRILIVGNLVYVPTAIFMAQQWGVVGLASCQLLQSVLMVILVWGASRRELPGLTWVPTRWDRSCFREILSYAAGLQLGNLLIMLFEPATKILLSRYCGLSEVAFFEMANQVVSRVKALVTSAMQAYLPVLSSTVNDIGTTRQLVGEAMVFTSGIGLPIMAGVVVSFPIISLLWIGDVKADFIVYGWILGIGWLIATLAMPAYYYCVGAGRVRVVVSSQALMVCLNAILGAAAALSNLGHWVAMSMMASLAAGNLLIARQTFADLQISTGQLLRMTAGSNAIRTIALISLALIVNIGFSVATSLGSYLYINFLFHAFSLLLIAYLSDAGTMLARRYLGVQ